MSGYYIPEPCHENWNKMTPREQGRHCASCDKVVVDFTAKSNDSIKQIMEETTGKVCGHFKIDQLNKEAQHKVFIQPKNLFTRNWKYFLLASFGLFSLNKKSAAQQLKGKVAIRGDVAPYDYHNTNTQSSVVKGMIKNEFGKGIGKASIKIYSNEKLIAEGKSIANGSYSIKIGPKSIENNTVKVVVTHDEYPSKEIYDLKITKEQTTLNVHLEQEYMLLGEVMYVPEDTTHLDTIKTCTDVTVETTDPIVPENTDSTQENSTNEDQLENNGINNLIARIEDIESTIFPNPTANKATVYCQKEGNYRITVYTQNGALLMDQKFEGKAFNFDVSAYENGTYLVLISDEKGLNNTMKLIKQ